MKARLLKKLLNDTGYIVGDYDEYIGVGSSYCHNLLSVDKKTFHLKYALGGTPDKYVGTELHDLFLCWQKLQELVATGAIREIIDGNDEIENPLPVYTVKEGKLVETYTDAYGWPNTTFSGQLMYENSYFPTKEQAIDYGRKELAAAISISSNLYSTKESELAELRDRIAGYEDQLAAL